MGKEGDVKPCAVVEGEAGERLDMCIMCIVCGVGKRMHACIVNARVWPVLGNRARVWRVQTCAVDDRKLSGFLNFSSIIPSSRVCMCWGRGACKHEQCVLPCGDT